MFIKAVSLQNKSYLERWIESNQQKSDQDMLDLAQHPEIIKFIDFKIEKTKKSKHQLDLAKPAEIEVKGRLPPLGTRLSIKQQRLRRKQTLKKRNRYTNNAKTLDSHFKANIGSPQLKFQDLQQLSPDAIFRRAVQSQNLNHLDYTQYLLGFQVKKITAKEKEKSLYRPSLRLDLQKKRYAQRFKIQAQLRKSIFQMESKVNFNSPILQKTDRQVLSIQPKQRFFMPRDQEATVFQMRMKRFHDYLFKINFSYSLLIDPSERHQNPKIRYKVYIGKGNNNQLIKSLFKRRHWWKLTQNKLQANFVWTQLKVNQYFGIQNKSTHICQVRTKSDNALKLIKKGKRQNAGPQMLQENQRLFSQVQVKAFLTLQKKLKDRLDNYDQRQKFLGKSYRKVTLQQALERRCQNHLPCNFHLGNKKALLYNLRKMYEAKGISISSRVPLTFHIQSQKSSEYLLFEQAFRNSKSKDNKNIWIVKPGQNSNRGNGITVIDQIHDFRKILLKKQKHGNGMAKSYIVQKYICNPLLYHKRKFDIRHYMLTSMVHGVYRGYWYSEGYIRTSSSQYSVKDLSDITIHLTNDAIQKYADNYGKFQPANKLSYQQFQRYLDQQFDKKINFYSDIYPKMRNIGKEAIESTALKLDPQRLQHNFQLFGLDFMILQDFTPVLIEVNTNPCLELACPLLNRIIPPLIQNTLRLVVDPLFPPLVDYLNSQQHLAPDNILKNMKFQLVLQLSGWQQRDSLQKASEDLQRVWQWSKRGGGQQVVQVQSQQQEYEQQGQAVDLVQI